MSDDTSLSTKGLDSILKMLKVKAVIRVGILGDKDSRTDGPSNSDIGRAHEYGTTTIAKRSFLREPIFDNLDKKLKEAELLDKETMDKIIKKSSPIDILIKLGIIAEGIVAEGFDTGGYGKWKEWKKPNYKNNTGQLLVDTTQLRNSITSQVVENGT